MQRAAGSFPNTPAGGSKDLLTMHSSAQACISNASLNFPKKDKRKRDPDGYIIEVGQTTGGLKDIEIA